MRLLRERGVLFWKTRVVHSTQYYWPFVGGAEKYCQDISEALGRSGFGVVALSTDVVSVDPLQLSQELSAVRNGVKIRRLRSFPFLNKLYGRKHVGVESDSFSPSYPLALKAVQLSDTASTWRAALAARAVSSAVPQHFGEIVNEFRNCELAALFNIVTGMSAISYVSAKIAARPIVTFPFFHFNLLSYERPSLYRLLKGSNAVVCSTSFERDELVKRGVERKKAFVVHEGLEDPSRSLEVKSVERLREQFGLDEKKNDFVVAYVGRRDFDKGFPHVLSAAAGLVRSGCSKVKLVVSGYGERGSELEDYGFLSGEGKLIDLGVADEKTKLAALSISDVVALPSRAETYPLVFAESWFLGKPVIGANIGSVASVVRSGVDGFIVDFGDVGGIMKAVKSLYDDRALSAKMGDAGREKARRELLLKNSISEIRSIYETVAGGFRS